MVSIQCTLHIWYMFLIIFDCFLFILLLKLYLSSILIFCGHTQIHSRILIATTINYILNYTFSGIVLTLSVNIFLTVDKAMCNLKPISISAKIIVCLTNAKTRSYDNFTRAFKEISEHAKEFAFPHWNLVLTRRLYFLRRLHWFLVIYTLCNRVLNL